MLGFERLDGVGSLAYNGLGGSSHSRDRVSCFDISPSREQTRVDPSDCIAEHWRGRPSLRPRLTSTPRQSRFRSIEGRRLALLTVLCALVSLGSVVATVGAMPARQRRAQRCKAPTPRGSVLPPLTNAQCVSATSIVDTDRSVALLLKSRVYAISQPTPWGDCEGTGDLGATFVVRLAAPLTIENVLLPVAGFGSGETTCNDNYKAFHFHFAIHGATSLLVFVDLRRRAVVWIIPQPDDSAIRRS